MTIFFLALHMLASACWVGGIFFAYMALRPSVTVIEPPARLMLWSAVLGRFFPWVWLFIFLLVVSGYGLMAVTSTDAVHVHIMQGTGWVMFVLFGWLYFQGLRPLKKAVSAAEFNAGAAIMTRMRPVMAINLVLGLVTVVVGATGRYWGL